MILEQSGLIVQEVKKAFMGKDDVIARVLTAIYAGGHVLLEDCPGLPPDHRLSKADHHQFFLPHYSPGTDGRRSAERQPERQ